LIAEGGFSFVYLVHGAQSKRRYAVKKVLCQSQEQIEAAKWEVSVHRELAPGRPHILGLQAATFRPAQPAGQEAYIVLDFHAGGTVDDILASRRAQLGVTPAGHLPWCYTESDALQLFAGVCQGVAAFHSHVPAWAHRDIKPANILLASGGSPVLMDFGSTAVGRVSIASYADSLRLKEQAEANSSMAYRAPELWDPPARSTVTEASDIWALGCVLYALAFGFSPFEIEWVHPRGSKAAAKADKASSSTPNMTARASVGGSVPHVVDVSHLRVLGRVPLPEVHPYSPHFIQLILDCLSQDASTRPDVGSLQDRTHTLLDMGGSGAAEDAFGSQGAFLGQDRVLYGSMASRAGAAHEIF
jgi:serine/threonine kinase 16